MTSSAAPYLPGRHLLQVPGPTNVPQRCSRRSHGRRSTTADPPSLSLALSVIAGLQRVFRTSQARS
jgi:aspartate aminotransferase-like enzyme